MPASILVKIKVNNYLVYIVKKKFTKFAASYLYSYNHIRFEEKLRFIVSISN